MPAVNVVTALLMVCPVFGLNVSPVIVWVLAKVTVMPSEGDKGMVTVPVAKVPAGFISAT